MDKRPPLRRSRAGRQYNSSRRRNIQPMRLVQRQSFVSRHRQRRRRQIITAAVAGVILLAVLLMIFLPKKQETLPVTNPEVGTSSEIISSIISEQIEYSEVDPQWQQTYEAASKIKLINFDHPNYDEPKELVDLNDLLDSCVTVNSGANRLEKEAAYALQALFAAAKQDGITTYIVNSAYRDRALQQSFWDNRIAKDPHYGDDVYANPVKTVPATASEHCTGLAVDILCDAVPHGTADYKDTAEAKWLAENAHKYGFILRYPDGKQSITGVMFEPWHYRYVGEAATDIYTSGLCLEEYLAALGLPTTDNTQTEV